MHVLMVDDHVMFLQGLKTLLGVMAPDLRVESADHLAGAERLCAAMAFDLVLLDWHLADADGELAMQRLRDAGCAAPIVVLSGETGPALVQRAIERGAAGFIPKTYSSEMMVRALGQVLAGCVFLPVEDALPDAAVAPARRGLPNGLDARLAHLTPRQIEVYRAAVRGLPNKLIARELGIEASTVKSHLSAVYGALGVSNRTEAAYEASREGRPLFAALR
jgi:DNA-binding NarL/FixJ family response regulator